MEIGEDLEKQKKNYSNHDIIFDTNMTVPKRNVCNTCLADNKTRLGREVLNRVERNDPDDGTGIIYEGTTYWIEKNLKISQFSREMGVSLQKMKTRLGSPEKTNRVEQMALETRRCWEKLKAHICKCEHNTQERK